MEAANWGTQLSTRKDNSDARTEPSEESAYVQEIMPGVSGSPRRFHMPNEKEPVYVWLIVVGSIAGLVLIGRAFRTAKA